jgi:signal transduction histidine kinase
VSHAFFQLARVMLQSRNRALAVYGLQVLLAIIAAPGDIVFAPFYRREPARDPAKAGVGLGLSIARSVAREHGGDNGGLRAFIELPA